MCPRRHIKEDPDWWQSMIMTYNAYEKGFLPGSGGIDDQPHLLVPLMATISSAISDEDELERQQAQRKKTMVNQSKGKGRPQSALHGGPTPGYAPVPIPKKRG